MYLKRMKKKLIILLTILLICTSFAFSKDYYDSGDQFFTISLGPSMPLSITNFSDNQTSLFPGEDGTKLYLGGTGSISYQVFFDPKFSVGGELGYQFNEAISKSLFTAVPMLARLTYFPIQGKIDVPISFGLGGTYLSFKDAGNAFIIGASVDIGINYYFKDSWSLGFSSGLYAMPELYINKDKFEHNSLATFVPMKLSFTYRQ